MSGGYYFLVASLPHLKFGAAPRLTPAQFLTRCAGQVSAVHHRILTGVERVQTQPAKTGLALLDRWYECERALRNALAIVRAERLGVTAAGHLRDASIRPLPPTPSHEGRGSSATELFHKASSPLVGEGGGGGYERLLRDFRPDPRLAGIAKAILALDSPRAADEELDRVRWRVLEELAFGHYFDVETLVVYLLKLRILERRARFDAAAGAALLDRLLAQGAERGREAFARSGN